MRVQNPLTYGEKLLSLVLPKERYTEARLRKMFGGGEININFPQFIPVHLTYQTAFVDDAGKLQLREDIYGRDAKMHPSSRVTSARLPILRSSARRTPHPSRCACRPECMAAAATAMAAATTSSTGYSADSRADPVPIRRATFHHHRRAIMAATAGARRQTVRNTKRRRIVAGVFVSTICEDGTGGWT